MCILLKLEYAKFGVSNLFLQPLLKKNLWVVGSTPLSKGRVKKPLGVIPTPHCTGSVNKSHYSERASALDFKTTPPGICL